MDIATIFLFCLMSLVIGAVLMLLIQYYAFLRYFNIPAESLEQKAINEKYSLPENILRNIKSSDPESKYPIVALNLIIQFLFHELKNSNRVRKWFYRKLSLELDELIAKTTTGKLFDKLTIRDLDLGAQFPEINNLRVHHANLHETEGHIENLDLVLELKYKGNFRLSIDADMVLGKKGSLTLRVKNLEGLARLQFTRKPYTHWSLSFLGDPQLDFDIESQFQGRQMQSNVTSLIISQIRKAVRRKHTLPNYKLRYKPFFNTTEEEYDCDIIPNGKIDIKISQLSRLNIPKHITEIYCTLTMASLKWVEARQQDDQNVIISLDIEIHKAKNQQIGIVFKQIENFVQVEAILPNTPALKANLRSGDNLISIEGKRVNTITQVAKIIKNLTKSVFQLRIERICPGLIRNDAIFEDFELNESLGDMNISFSKSTESVQMIGSKNNSIKLLRKGSLENRTSETNTPTNSPRKPQTIGKIIKNFSRENSEVLTDDLLIETIDGKLYPKIIETLTDSLENELENFQQHSTIDCSANSFIVMEDLSQFKLNDKCNYLNISVYGKCVGESMLLGYVNVPINSVLIECCETSLGQYLKQYSLLPPYPQELKDHNLSAQSGFYANYCFGDILVAFVWNGNTVVSPPETPLKKSKPNKGSTDKLEDEDKIEFENTKSHNFIRTHFHRATQCDFCGKKIWLKDAVQCRDCSMCCHKKCINKCQDSTVCGPVDCGLVTTTSSITTTTIPSTTIISNQKSLSASASASGSASASSAQPEFTLTEPQIYNDENSDDYDEIKTKQDSTSTGHRQSFSGLIAQGLKRVNSVNNLAIPGIVSSLGQSSRSLPPSPQHTPRKQSLVNQSINPFNNVIHKLEQIPDNVTELTKDEINSITETLIGCPSEEIMSLAKTSSKTLYADLDTNERVNKINKLLSKLRIALDSETSTHAALLASNINTTNTTATTATATTTATAATTTNEEKSLSVTFVSNEPIIQSKDLLLLQTKPPPTSSTNDLIVDKIETEMARKTLLLGQCEQIIQALSVIMLYLCTGLQHAQLGN